MTPPEIEPRARAWITRAFSVIEDAVYIGLGVLLAISLYALQRRDGISAAHRG